MEFHKYANLFALIEGKEFDLLVRDIKENGLNNPIVLYEGKILDGRNRYLACKEIGIEPETKVFNSGGDPLTFVLSENLRRRHLTTSQRAALAAEVANMTHGGNRKIDQSPNLDFDHSTKKVGELFNVSRSNIFEAKKIKSENQDLFNELKTGESTIQQAKREIVKTKIKERPELPTDKYRVIYADPPWKYGNTQPDYQTEQADYYQLMDIPEICEMRVKEIADDNAVLFLWVTSPILEEAFQVIKAWGFKYKASFVWDKIGHNMGHYNSVRHEFLLICVKGSCQPDEAILFDSVQSIDRTKHSEKPGKFREIIDTIYPYGKRIELFAREKIESWDAYGNEIS
ncbi:MAG: MT-A70 family methyltransferase [Candidatus Marinimicrobia bacterium]|jgi:N6-adenosine-specific RNA methylase IME4|nr:MT-A70 family methyltransferase [Candidatus Neomarinimicrobiota bacterium]